MRTPLVAVAIFALGTVASVATTPQAPRVATQAQPRRAEPVSVPTGDSTPVITDGFFSPGEWDDALKVPIADGVTILLKEFRGVVFFGVRCPGGMTDLWLAPPGGPIERLHVSFALAEMVVPPSGRQPPVRAGITAGWHANRIRSDEEENNLLLRLAREGQDMMRMPDGTNYPSEGVEFAIRRSKIPGPVWLMRLSTSAIVAGRPGEITYPPSTADRSTIGWLELRFK